MATPAEEIAQRDLLGTSATIARASGWTVIELHGNRTNPRQQSGPDHLLLRQGSAPRAHKHLLKGDLTGTQETQKALYEDAGITYALYHATAASLAQLVTDLA